MDEKKTGIDINYRVISYFDVDLDKKYPSIDIFYPKSTKKVW
jgi:hypothetical protein